MTFDARPIWSVTAQRRVVVDPSVLDRWVVHYSIPALELAGIPDVVHSREIQSQKFRVMTGDVLVGRLNPRKSRVCRVRAHTEDFVIASTEFVVLRPTGIDARFLEYAFRSEIVRQQLGAQVRSVTRSHQRNGHSTRDWT